MDISGKVIVVTGASAGIGLETARLLARQGARVALNARSQDKLEALARELPGSLVVVADVAVESEARRLIADVHRHFGRIDALVNNAGRGMTGSVESFDVAEYRRIFDLNVVGPLAAMQAAIPLMRAQGGGAIVNVSSGTALMYAPGISAYSSTKRALGGLSLTARAELAGDNIAVSIVYPYVTKSDFYKNLATDNPRFRSADDVVAGRAPADTSEFVAELIVSTLISGDAEVYAHDWMKPGAR